MIDPADTEMMGMFAEVAEIEGVGTVAITGTRSAWWECAGNDPANDSGGFGAYWRIHHIGDTEGNDRTEELHDAPPIREWIREREREDARDRAADWKRDEYEHEVS